MDLRSWPSIQRAAHYREQATKLREMAEQEALSRARDNLKALADQYDELAKAIAQQPRS